MENLQRIRSRDPEHFPDELKFLLDLITINEVPKVVGSYAYKNHRYPSDVDVFERVTVKLNKENSAEFYANSFRNIFQKLTLCQQFYINDFKAGKNLLDEPIRWTRSEVLEGYKSGLLLKEALMQEAVVKLDVIAWISGKFQSVEVFYSLRFFDEINGTFKEFYPMKDYVKSLTDDINKYASKEYYNPLKVIKRLWSLSRIKNCNDLVFAIDPLLSSDTAALNQLKSDIEVLIDLNLQIYTRIKNQINLIGPAESERTLRYYDSINKMFLQILSINKRLSNHTHIEAISLTDQIFKYWVNYSKIGLLDFQFIENQLKKLVTELQDKINTESEKYLQMVESMNIKCQLNHRLITEIDYEI